MIILRWRCADKKAVADANVAAFVQKTIQEGNCTVEISNYLVLLGFRAAIARGELLPNEVIFDVNGKVHEFNSSGAFKQGFPAGPVFDLADIWTCEIVEAGLRNHERRYSR